MFISTPLTLRVGPDQPRQHQPLADSPPPSYLRHPARPSHPALPTRHGPRHRPPRKPQLLHLSTRPMAQPPRRRRHVRQKPNPRVMGPACSLPDGDVRATRPAHRAVSVTSRGQQPQRSLRHPHLDKASRSLDHNPAKLPQSGPSHGPHPHRSLHPRRHRSSRCVYPAVPTRAAQHFLPPPNGASLSAVATG